MKAEALSRGLLRQAGQLLTPRSQAARRRLRGSKSSGYSKWGGKGDDVCMKYSNWWSRDEKKDRDDDHRSKPWKTAGVILGLRQGLQQEGQGGASAKAI